MAEIGTATVKITPVVDEDALAQVDTAVREAVADALRKVADSLTAKPTGASPGPRYYVEQINGIWGVRDREVPGEWAAWGDDGEPESKPDADQSADDLNAGERRGYVAWSPPGTYS